MRVLSVIHDANVDMGPDVDCILEMMGREGSVWPGNPAAGVKTTVMLHSRITRSGLLEELIHTVQVKKYEIAILRDLFENDKIKYEKLRRKYIDV